MAETLDTSDVDKYIGHPVGGGQLKEPITVTDIRRWVQAMNYPNPRHFDDDAAAATSIGRIVAPQSFTICGDTHQGCRAAIVGVVPNTHAVFAGDEWWFYGPQIFPGDKVGVRRQFLGYKLSDTKFSGPTMFCWGDTTYVNQRHEAIAKQRCTMARYRPDLARGRDSFETMESAPSFTAEQLDDIQRQRTEWILSGRDGRGPGDVKVGQTLPTRPIGPHTLVGFVTEWRGFIHTVWGSQVLEGRFDSDAGWLPEMKRSEGDGTDPAMLTGIDEGPGSSHVNLDKAKLVGLPRNYGYGASMGAWILDYLAYWAGDDGFIRHSKLVYRSPVFEGDLAFVNGEVTKVGFDPLLGCDIVTVAVSMTNQDGVGLAHGDVEIQLSGT